jgi:hypothetical protein
LSSSLGERTDLEVPPTEKKLGSIAAAAAAAAASLESDAAVEKAVRGIVRDFCSPRSVRERAELGVGNTSC